MVSFSSPASQLDCKEWEQIIDNCMATDTGMVVRDHNFKIKATHLVNCNVMGCVARKEMWMRNPVTKSYITNAQTHKGES